MNIDELISKLESIRESRGGQIVCCTYDSVLMDYTSNLCLEIVDDDYYIDEDGEKVIGEEIILF